MDVQTRMKIDVVEYAKFLELPEGERFEHLSGVKLYWWQKLYLKWWGSMRKANPHLRTYDLWESMYKGRF